MDTLNTVVLIMDAMRRAARRGAILIVEDAPMQATSAIHAIAGPLHAVVVVLDADRTNLNDLAENSPLRERAVFAGLSETRHLFVLRGVASMMDDPRLRHLRSLIGPDAELLLVVDEAAEPLPDWTLCDLRD